MNIEELVTTWIERDPDPACREELQSLLDQGNSAELQQRFDGRLEFGTAGLRGLVGAGPTRMNRLVVRETSAGLGAYLLSTVPNAASRGVVVAYDGRPDSRQFAEDAACTLAAMDIIVYLSPDVAATPIAAFAVLDKGAAAGVVITASHNPPEYNGYKVYWENGAQIIPPHDAGIASAIVTAAGEALPWLEMEEAIERGKLALQDESFYHRYMEAIQASPLFTAPVESAKTSVAYTAMHGVGGDIARALLTEHGFSDFYSVPSQHQPDGTFPTVSFPNPEEPGAMDRVVQLATEKKATLACANDPDADRLAVAVRQDSGDYRVLSGDQVGVLLADYLLSMDNPFTPIVCSTIVSSSMLGRIAAARGAIHFETLTGFKWLANTAMQREDATHHFLFAYEEALGYAIGEQVRDKDGLSALLAFMQMAEVLAERGSSVEGQLEGLYRQHGIHLTAQRSLALNPDARPICDSLREQKPSRIGDAEITMVDDLLSGTRTYANGSSATLDLPASDVLTYRLGDGSRVIVRPSGTEPKVKCYYEIVQAVTSEDFGAAMEQAETSLAKLVSAHQAALAEIDD